MTEKRLPNDRSAWEWIFGGPADREAPVGQDVTLAEEPDVVTAEKGAEAVDDVAEEGGPETRMTVRPLEDLAREWVSEKNRPQAEERHLRNPVQEWRRAVVLSEILGPPKAVRRRWGRF